MRTIGPDHLPPTDSNRLVCARSCDLRSSCISGSIGEDRGSRPPILILIDLFALEVGILGHCAWVDPEGRTRGPDPHIDSDRLVCA